MPVHRCRRGHLTGGLRTGRRRPAPTDGCRAAFGHDEYTTLRSKAAALLHSLVRNHALVDGNKRLGWLATAVFLELDDQPVTAGDDDELVMQSQRAPRASRRSRAC